MVIQDSQFHDVLITDPDAAVTLKVYSAFKTLIEDTIHYNGITAIELKSDVRQFTVRHNTLFNLTGNAIGGNMHACPGCGAGGVDLHTTRGEILFNSVRVSGSTANALNVNQDGQALQVSVYRNTFFGRVNFQSVDASDGPFYVTRNVIVNGDSGTPANSHVTHMAVTSPSRIVMTDNLAGFPGDNIIGTDNNLTTAYGSFLGIRGYQTSQPSGGLQMVQGLRIAPQ
jgi:hypothetical protein